jgi:ABC-type sugar transport system permease subunit
MPTDSRQLIARREFRLAVQLLAPALLVISVVGLLPLVWTAWESLHLHDLRMPWLRRPFIGLANYAEAFATPRFREALGHTAFFTATSVALELVLGTLLALALDRVFRWRGVARAAALLPWAIPTVVSGLLWRFMFEGGHGGVLWFVEPRAAWVPIILADVWKSTPFVAILVLAGLQTIDPSLYEAARIDGAGAWRRFRHLTLPLLRPALLVALIFRTLDAFRVFDLVYVMTGGGPGTSTEPVSLYAFEALLQDLRFGYGSALSVLVFLLTFTLAWLYIRLLGQGVSGAAR